MSKIKVSAVSFLNTKCFVKGLQESEIFDQLELSLDVPSVGAQKLVNNEVDLALVPVAIIPELDSYHIISDYCISCDGHVSTVCVYSDIPFFELEAVQKDSNSKTSNALLQIIIKKLQFDVKVIESGAGDNDKTGKLIIGDRAIEAKSKYKYEYDLGQAWKVLTGLPFVFAAWISTQKLEDEFVSQFNQSLELGISKLPEIVVENKKLDTDHFRIEEYLYHNISYYMTDDKRGALDYFIGQL